MGREGEDTTGGPWLVVSQMMAILVQTCVLHWVMQHGLFGLQFLGLLFIALSQHQKKQCFLDETCYIQTTKFKESLGFGILKIIGKKNIHGYK